MVLSEEALRIPWRKRRLGMGSSMQSAQSGVSPPIITPSARSSSSAGRTQPSANFCLIPQRKRQFRRCPNYPHMVQAGRFHGSFATKQEQRAMKPLRSDRWNPPIRETELLSHPIKNDEANKIYSTPWNKAMLLDNLSSNACSRRTYSAASVRTILDVVQARGEGAVGRQRRKWTISKVTRHFCRIWNSDLLASIRTRWQWGMVRRRGIHMALEIGPWSHLDLGNQPWIISFAWNATATDCLSSASSN